MPPYKRIPTFGTSEARLKVWTQYHGIRWYGSFLSGFYRIVKLKWNSLNVIFVNESNTYCYHFKGIICVKLSIKSIVYFYQLMWSQMPGPKVESLNL